MELLSRVEELLLLSVIELRENAYGVTLREKLNDTVGKIHALAVVYVSLDRLVARGLLDTVMTAPEPVRGGRAKRTYRITADGLKVLNEHYELQQKIWKNAPALLGISG